MSTSTETANRIVHALVEDRTARGIAAAISRLITAGELAPGDQLPTVRALARALGVSPSTVSQSWRVLAAAGVISTGGRLGTTVVGAAGLAAPRRYRGLSGATGQYRLDLSTGTPDPDLLPDLSAALARVSRSSLTSSYQDEPVLPALSERLRDQWPFPAEALTVVDGAMDALDRLASALVRLGDRVVVENPSFPPLLDLLEQLGADVIGVPIDDDGPEPSALAAAMEHQPVAVFLQPRAHNPAGSSVTPARARELAAILRPATAVIIEDDHAGDIAWAPLVSLGDHLPARTILIRSFSKSHGPDLRLAAVGGAGEPISQIVQRRMLGPGWSSRLLQAVLDEMLGDAATISSLAHARADYRQRRLDLTAGLVGHGLTVRGHDGINVWIEVPDERRAQLALAARGIGIAARRTLLRESRRPGLRAADDQPAARRRVGTGGSDRGSDARAVSVRSGLRPLSWPVPGPRSPVAGSGGLGPAALAPLNGGWRSVTSTGVRAVAEWAGDGMALGVEVARLVE